MKLPLYFSQEPGPRFGSVDYSNAVPQHIRQLGQRIEETGWQANRALNQIMAPLIEKENREREIDILNNASLMDNDFALGAQDIISNERSKFTDRDSYKANVDKGLAQLVQKISSKYPKEYHPYAQRQMADRLTNLMIKEEDWGDARWLEQQRGSVETSLEKFKQDALIAVRSGDTAAFQRTMTEQKALLGAQLNITMTAKEISDRQNKLVADIDKQRFSIDYMKNPTTAVKSLVAGDYPGIPADEAMSIAQSQQDRILRDNDRIDKDIEKATGKAQDNLEMDFVRRIRRGEDISEDLDVAIGSRTLKKEQIDSILSFEKGQKGQKEDSAQDEDLALSVTLDVRGSNPTISEAQIKRMMNQNADHPGTGLNPKTGVPLLEHLVQYRKALGDEKKAGLSQKHSNAESRLSEAIRGTAGPLEQITKEQAKALAQARTELWERSSFGNGTEDPSDLVKEMIPRYSQITAKDMRLSNEKILRLLKFRTPSLLMQAYKLGKISQADYQYQLSLFDTLRSNGMVIDSLMGEQKPFQYPISPADESAGRAEQKKTQEMQMKRRKVR